jgi:hypothetical protein
MKHTVKVYNKTTGYRKVENSSTAKQAEEYYLNAIRVVKPRLPKGEEVLVVRLNDGDIMCMEDIIGTN